MSPNTDAITLIEQTTRRFASRREILADRIHTYEEEVRAVLHRKLRGIKSALAELQDAQAELNALIDQNPQLFTKPKTLTFEGIKVGYAKQKGKVEFADADKVVKLIKKHLPDQADTLIKTEEKPLKTALANLDVKALKSIGCTVTDSSDIIVIKPQDSELDKVLNKILELEEPTT